MDILLVIPPRIVDDFGYTPAAPALLKGSLNAAGYSSKIIDFNKDIDTWFMNDSSRMAEINNFFMYNNFYNEKVWEYVSVLIDQWAVRIVSLNPKWVGFSVFSYNSQRATRLLATRIRFHNPSIKIVIGGMGIDNNFCHDLHTSKIIDYYIKGEGERALIELLNGNPEYPGINGIPPQQILDLDNLAFPDYSDYELKTYTNKKGLEALPITGSRGCVRNCTFCDVASMWPKYYYRSGENIADEIIHQIEKYDVRAFRFTDSLINGSMKSFRGMCNHLADYREKSGKDFIWDTHFIVRSKKQMPPEDFDIMKRAGAGTMLIGVESGSERVRNHMRKGFSQEDLDYTMSQLIRCNIKCRILIIVGYPIETEDDFQETMDMFTRYKDYAGSIIEETNLGLSLNLLPGTPLYYNKDHYNIIQYNNHINDWICTDNPDLTYKERIKRRIRLQAHVERLGYSVFESRNYTRQLFNSWQEVQNANRNTTQGNTG